MKERLLNPATAPAAMEELTKGGKPVTKVKVSTQTSASTFGNGKGHQESVEGEVTPEQAQKVIDGFNQGGMKGAARGFGETTVTRTERDFETRGIVVRPSIPVGGTSVGGEAGAVTEKTTGKKTTTGKAKDLIG
jgi:hypothetical protein